MDNKIKGIEIIDATEKFIEQGFKKIIKTTNELVKLEDAKEESRLKCIVEVGKREGAIAKIILGDALEEVVLIHFSGEYYPQLVMVEKLQKKMETYFKYIKK